MHEPYQEFKWLRVLPNKRCVSIAPIFCMVLRGAFSCSWWARAELKWTEDVADLTAFLVPHNFHRRRAFNLMRGFI
jgi:hypothetical protein